MWGDFSLGLSGFLLSRVYRENLVAGGGTRREGRIRRMYLVR